MAFAMADTGRKVLAVDLDGTLLRSDMLFESFWSAFSGRWSTPFAAAQSLAGGRANLKQTLSNLANVDVTGLPYNDAVISHIQQWRDDGGTAVLVTATDSKLAEAIAAHLGIFDEVHGSDGKRNLKGAAKAAFLEERYGHQGFTYMGDCDVDLPVWSKAGSAVAVTSSASLKRKLQQLHDTAHFIDHPAPKPISYLKALRPHQWSKNMLIFLPMFAAQQFDTATIIRSVIAFVAFSLIASSVYVLNDLLDLSPDRAHPRKRNRPFASGAVPIAHGTWLAAGCLIAGFAASFALGWPFVIAIAAYYVLTLAYSLDIKRRLVIDICTLATLYMMRIIAGGAATDIPLSVWLLAFALFFFFSLAAVKRQAELIDAATTGKLKAHGRGYQVPDVAIVSQMATGSGLVAVLVMALYVNSPTVVELYPNPPALWGICVILLYWISRMVMITHRGHMHDDPIVFAAKDPNSLVCAVLIGVCALAAVLPL